MNHAVPAAVIREGSLDEILGIHQQVPELEPVADVTSYEQRLAGRRWLGLVAEYDGRPAAFKLGYCQDEHCFYSWVGGVIPSARRAGLAKALLDAQELRLLQLGVREVTVKSMNRFPGMMALLISNGYRIVGLEGDDPATSKICFSKPLREVAGRGGVEIMELGAFSVSLAVKDLEKSRVFYEKLGFEMFHGDPTHNFLIMKNGDTVIGLFQGMFENNILTFNPGWDSSANELSSFTDVRDLQRSLKEQGVELQSEVDEAGSGPGSFVVLDPDGNAILIDQHR